MDLKRIIQREDEEFHTFVERAIEEAKDTNETAEIVFDNGTIIKTDNIDLNDENVISQIINEYQTKRAQAEELESLECVDLLETILKVEKLAAISESTERLNKLKSNYDKLKEELNAEFKTRIEQANRLILNEKKIEEQKVDSIDKELEELKDKLLKYEEDIKSQREKMQEEEQLLNNYKSRLEELKKEENPDLHELKEVTDKVIYYNWSMEAYTEYIDFINNQYIEPSKISLDELGKTREEIVTNTKERITQIFDEYVVSKFGKPTKINGKTEATVANSPELIQIAEEIQKEEVNLEHLEKQNDFDSIKKMIKEREASPAELVEQLSLLTKNQENVELEDILGINKGKIKDNTDKISSLKSKIEQYKEKLANEENFYDKEQMEQDKISKEKLEQEIQQDNIEIGNLEEQLRNYIRTKKLPQLKSKLKTVTTTREYLENSIRNCELSKEDVENYEKTIKSLSKEEEKLDQKIQKINEDKKLIIPAVVEFKRRNLTEKVNNNTIELEELNAKTNEDYIDRNLIAKTQQELERLEEELEKLESRKDDLNKITVQDINDKIIANYIKLTNENSYSETEIGNYYEIQKEELLGFEDAPKSLIQKIKSSEFVKKAAQALASLAVVGTIAVTAISGLKNNNNSTSDVITEQDMTDEADIEYQNAIEDIDIDLGEPFMTVSYTEPTPAISQIESMQNDALQDIIDSGMDAMVHDDVYDAANETNPLRVGDNIPVWETAKPGAIYAIQGDERIQININEAEKYMNDGYDIVSAYTNDGEIIGFTSLTKTESIDETMSGKSI